MSRQMKMAMSLPLIDPLTEGRPGVIMRTATLCGVVLAAIAAAVVLRLESRAASMCH